MNINKERYSLSLAIFLTTVTMLALVIVPACQAQAQKASSGLNLVYLESDISTADGNTVLGFSNDGLGNLTPLPGSPYLTSGTGVGGSGNQFDASGQVIINPEGTLLFAVNGDSDTVAAFSINSDGSLTAAPGSPFASGGQDPASLALKDDPLGDGVSRMVVVNKDSDPNQTGGAPNYTTFDVSATGVMTMNPGSTYDLAAGSSPAEALMSPKSNKFFGAEFLNNKISSYSYSGQGLITQISTETPPGSSPQVVAVAAHPSKRIVYAAMPNQAQIAVYSYDSAGSLTYVEEVANQGMAICWLTMNPAGTRLYSAETNSGTLTVYDTASASNPAQLQHLTLTGEKTTPTNLALDPTGAFLYVLGRNGLLHVLSVSAEGTLTELNAVNLDLPAGTTPLGVAVAMK